MGALRGNVSSHFLHLTDLHLGPPQPIDDVKSSILPQDARFQKIDSLYETLGAIGDYMSDVQQTLDAVIVSGDITYQGDPSGFEQLPGLLAKLGKAKPVDSRRIVVLPGNHDVDRRAETPTERYKSFLELIDSENYTAPAIEGVTLKKDGSPTNRRQHYLIDPEAGWLILPINCAELYGSYEPLPAEFVKSWGAVVEALDPSSSERRALERGLNELRFRDVGRISKIQFKALRTILRAANAEAKDSKGVLRRIAVIHHHLLPVTDVEEFKPFESLTNLGAFRSFLAHHAISVLIHGHKHSRLAYWDHIAPADGKASEHRLLVLAGETVMGNRAKDEIAQLITLRGKTHAPQLDVVAIPHCDTAKQVAARPAQTFNLWSEVKALGGATVVRGETLNEAYDRLLAHFSAAEPETYVTDLVCEVSQGASCGQLPGGYPVIKGCANDDDRQAWLDSMVMWWQTDWSWPSDYPYFTHGGRIRQSLGGTTQWDRAIQALEEDLRSSRAIISLIDPLHDLIPLTRRKFPAFVMLQMFVTGNEAAPKLDLVGYFRKHEMKWWWPINVAELHALQKKAVRELKIKRSGIKPGSIMTVSAIAKIGETAPQVAITLIDRVADEDPQKLFAAASYCFLPASDSKKASVAWKDLVDDLRPPDLMNADGVPVAIRGLEVLIQHLRGFASLARRSDKPAELIENLQGVLDANREYLDIVSHNRVDLPSHDKWKRRVNKDLDAAWQIARSLINRQHRLKGTSSHRSR